MGKLLLLSVLVMMVVLPIRAARVRDPKRSLRKAMSTFFAFNLFYWVTVLVVWFALILGGDPSKFLKQSQLGATEATH